MSVRAMLTSRNKAGDHHSTYLKIGMARGDFGQEQQTEEEQRFRKHYDGLLGELRK